MYTHYFNLHQAPFSIAPDPRYLFMSERHREALAHLVYGIGSGGGFVLLTGEIGAGKTTVCRCFMEQLPSNARLAYIFNPKLSVEELLQTICEEFHLEPAPASGVKGYVDVINRYLLESHAQGNNNMLVIDEAQNLSTEVLEQLRLLTNLETSERKLLQIILIGQPELRTMVERPELEQLAQRVIARYHLGPLTEAETGAYVVHRLQVAGAYAASPIPGSLTPLIFELTRGVPRRINLLCDRALLGAYAENNREVTAKILRRSADEVFAGERITAMRRDWSTAVGGGVAVVVLCAVLAWQVIPRSDARNAPAAATAPAVQAAKATRGAKATKEAAPSPPVQLAGAPEALRELATQWGQPLNAGAPCEAALSANLRCYMGKGGLYEIRLLNRPAVVSLRDGARQGYAVLTAVGPRSVTLAAGGKRQTVDVADFVQRFDGTFTTFWKVPRGFREHVVVGDRGADVDWIAGQLSHLNKVSAPPFGEPLKGRTEKMLRSFQESQNLKADGVAGPLTYMRLNQLSGIAEPRLIAAAGTGK